MLQYGNSWKTDHYFFKKKRGLSYKQSKDLLNNDNNKCKFKLIFGVDLRWGVMSPLYFYLFPLSGVGIQDQIQVLLLPGEKFPFISTTTKQSQFSIVFSFSC